MVKLLAVVCAAVFFGILTAGLWPFHHPKNDVFWSSNGLRFGKYGTVVSPSAFLVTTSKTIEIQLQPAMVDDAGTILSIFEPGGRRQLGLRQSWTDLAIYGDSERKAHAAMYVENVFARGTMVFLTITSGSSGTAVYINGSLARSWPGVQVLSRDLTGRLVLGDSPRHSDTWPGQVGVLALYSRELAAATVLEHYRLWREDGRPNVDPKDDITALYRFDEHLGNVIHNQVKGGIDLSIPGRYMVLEKEFLEPVWEEVDLSWGYWKNVFINVGGFVPLGFFFCFYFCWARKMERAAFVTVALGAATSLVIEVGQGFLPMRQSGTSDLIMNTLGTVLGVWLFQRAAKIRSSLFVVLEPEYPANGTACPLV